VKTKKAGVQVGTSERGERDEVRRVEERERRMGGVSERSEACVTGAIRPLCLTGKNGTLSFPL